MFDDLLNVIRINIMKEHVNKNEQLVESLLNKKIKNGVVYYLVKWKGNWDKFNSWEREEELQDYWDLIEKFEKQNSNDNNIQLLGNIARDDVP